MVTNTKRGIGSVVAVAAALLVLAPGVLAASDTNPFVNGSKPQGSNAGAYPFMSELAAFQRDMNEVLSSAFKNLVSNLSVATLLSLFGIAIVYGFVHAMSPGHGKTVLSVWILAEKRNLRWVAAVSYGGALFHVSSAIVLSSLIWLILSRTSLVDQTQAEIVLRYVASILLIGMGVRDMWTTIRSGKGHEHRQQNGFLLALSIGVVPCPISTFIMAFALGLGSPATGVVVCLIFGLGLGTALFSMALLFWLLRERAQRFFTGRFKMLFLVFLPAVGAVLLIAIGTLSLPLWGVLRAPG